MWRVGGAPGGAWGASGGAVGGCVGVLWGAVRRSRCVRTAVSVRPWPAGRGTGRGVSRSPGPVGPSTTAPAGQGADRGGSPGDGDPRGGAGAGRRRCPSAAARARRSGPARRGLRRGSVRERPPVTPARPGAGAARRHGTPGGGAVRWASVRGQAVAGVRGTGWPGCPRAARWARVARVRCGGGVPRGDVRSPAAVTHRPVACGHWAVLRESRLLADDGTLATRPGDACPARCPWSGRTRAVRFPVSVHPGIRWPPGVGGREAARAREDIPVARAADAGSETRCPDGFGLVPVARSARPAGAPRGAADAQWCTHAVSLTGRADRATAGRGTSNNSLTDRFPFGRRAARWWCGVGQAWRPRSASGSPERRKTVSSLPWTEGISAPSDR